MTVGTSALRIDAAAKVTGEAQYPGDRIPPEALAGHVVFTNQPHARLKRLDVTNAKAMAGVVEIFTAQDVPVNEYGLTLKDQPVFVDDVSRWEADHLALVVAETPEQARRAALEIEAEWEPLPLANTIDEGTEYYSLKIRKGDMESGWADSAVIVEATYEFPYQEHAYLQPEAGLAYIDDHGRVTVEVAGQWVHEDREQIAHSLGLDEDQVRVIYPAIGGAFGGREDVSLQIVLALAAWKLGRPVGSVWSREESIVGHHKRHRGRIEARWGAAADGKITAVQSEAWLDAGAYNYTSNKVLGNCHLGQSGPYEVPNAKVDSHAVYTNSVPAGAFRGFGGPQAAFVAECQMNKLANALGIDPIEMRQINSLRDGSIGITQTPMPAGVTMPQVLERAAIEATSPPAHKPFSPFATLPPSAEAIRHGRGIACSFKNVGFSFGFPERCEATVAINEDGTVDLYHAGADLGQGAHTAFVQMAATALEKSTDQIRGHFSDSATSGDSGSSSASRMTWMAGNSILEAAKEAEKAWSNGERPAVGHVRFVPPATETLDPETGVGAPNFTYGYVAQLVDLSVDIETGHIVIDRVVSIHDVGRAINPAQVVGQIEGGVMQAHGYTLTENLQVADGRILNPRLSQYLIPGIADGPDEIKSVVLELADPLGPWGARGMAEMPLMTYAPAVIAALHDATGVWFDSFPLTAPKVLERLS